MYQFVLGKISTLCADPLASTLADMAPQGARNASWLAGRTLLARTLSPSPLPEIVYGEQGKPAFVDAHPDAKKLFSEMKLPVADINAQNKAMHDGANKPADIERHVNGWIKAHQQTFDQWIADAKAAAQ